jgi:hypothetical protein
MSIATLKRKTQTQYNNMSVGQKNFSINGTRRSQGYVGQTSLSRSLPRTLMNGPTPRGHGGCCGNYPLLPIVQSAVTSLNDPTIVKSSVINTNGMINEKLNCINNVNQLYFITCGPISDCYNTVKPDNNQHLNHQSDFIKNKAKQTVQQSNLLCNINKNKDPCNKSSSCKNKDAYFYRGPSYITHTKPQSDYVNISQSEYVINKNNNCISKDIISIPNTNSKNTPFGCGGY